MKATVFEGDCLEWVTLFEDNYFDSLVTDPPYGLSFMGKDWDHGVPGTHFWKEFLRVAKPGAHLLAFGGTRTHHRLMVAIEDAGWEIRDCLMWVYGCLSEDTEILTINGWERYHKSTNFISDKIPILVYDVQKGIFKWEIPERWSTYRIFEDSCYRIQSDNTDQLVSRNHRCLVERNGKLVFVPAEELSEMEYMPTLPDNFFELYKGQSKVLFSSVQRLLSRAGLETVGEDWRCNGISRDTKEMCIARKEEPRLERWSDILQNTWKLYWGKIRSLPYGVFTYGSEGWICDGTPTAYGATHGADSLALGSCASYRSRSNEQLYGEFDAIQEQSNPQITRRYGITKAKVTQEKYTGIVFCPTVSTGAFVARRNGKVFITGNSGFPKSLDVSKAIDKAAGARREVIGLNIRTMQDIRGGGFESDKAKEKERLPSAITVPATDAAKQWSGWGTALKPAYEIIILAQKPHPKEQHINIASLYNIEAKLWSLLPANVAEKNFGLNPVEFKEAFDSVQWNAEEKSNIQEGLFDQMDTPQFVSVMTSCLNTVILWRTTLGEFSNNVKTSTISTEIDPTIDLKILNSCLLVLTPHTIIRDAIQTHGQWQHASPAVKYLNAVSQKLHAIHTLSAPEVATLQELIRHPEGTVVSKYPAWEPIILARKPLDGTVAGNVLKWGCGGINVDGCRVETQDNLNGGAYSKGQYDTSDTVYELGLKRQPDSYTQPTGRFPANFIHDGSQTVLDMFPNTQPSKGNYVRKTGDTQFLGVMGDGRTNTPDGLCDSGSASRFFYCAKASKSERNIGCENLQLKTAGECTDRQENTAGLNSPRSGAGRTNGSRNHHPTVKPLALLQYLCRLITPPNGIILDPFAGSGSTGLAATREGFNSVMIEIDRGYCEIARARNT